MLTQEQKDLLEPLTRHEKYGKLLIDAMKTWEIGEPKRGTYGIAKTNNVWEFGNAYKRCCMVGASVIGKSGNNSYLEEAMTTFNLSLFSVLDLARGFDDSSQYSAYLPGADFEAYQFGSKVSAILFS